MGHFTILRNKCFQGSQNVTSHFFLLALSLLYKLPQTPPSLKNSNNNKKKNQASLNLNVKIIHVDSFHSSVPNVTAADFLQYRQQIFFWAYSQDWQIVAV